MSNAPAISFIVVRCADIERSRAFYEVTLGVGELVISNAKPTERTTSDQHRLGLRKR
jgi:hypothetical protein